MIAIEGFSPAAPGPGSRRWRTTSAKPIGRLPTLAQVADAAVFLASDRAGAITGSVVDLSCGSAVRAHQFGQALVGVLD